jgi:hypothetical protein
MKFVHLQGYQNGSKSNRLGDMAVLKFFNAWKVETL